MGAVRGGRPAIDIVMSSYAAVEPALGVYATLDDEQKARLLSA